MSVKYLAAAVSIVSLGWLGLSFATPIDVPEDPRLDAGRLIEVSVPEAVSAEHPDSHRLGAVSEEKVVLPSWTESGAVDPGGLLALLGE